MSVLKELKSMTNCQADDYPDIPQEAFRYFPKLNDQRQIQEKGRIVRCIYHDSLQFEPQENQQLQKLDHYITQQGIQLDAFWDRGWRLRWMTSTNFNVEKTFKDMIWYDQFRNKNRNPKYTKVIDKFLKSGCYYIGGRDAKYRPILVFDIKKILSLGATQQQLIQSQTYFFDYVVQNILIPGQVQNWICIIDNGFQGLFSFLGPMKTTINFLTSTYRCRMFAINLVNAPSSVYYVWKVIQKLLDPIQVKKINIFDDEKPRRILELASPLQIQQKFGGKAINKVSFWPYQEISPYYQFSQCPIELISKAEYQQKYSNMKLINTKIRKSLVIDILTSTSTMQSEQKQENQNIQSKIATDTKIYSSESKIVSRVTNYWFEVNEEIVLFELDQLQLGPCLCQQFNL